MVNLRLLTIKDIGQALKLSAGENWNQTETEWKLLISHPGNICLALEAEDRIIGTATAMNYCNEVAWIGMVLVHPEFRGRGLSKKLLSTLIDRLDPSIAIKLDATPAGKPVYEKFGFMEEYRINRMVADRLMIEPSTIDHDICVSHVTFDNLFGIIEFDRKVFGAERKTLLELILKENPGCGWVAEQNGEIAGFVLGRAGRRYYHIGPLQAESEAVAEILVNYAIGNVKGRSVVLDVLNDKNELTELLKYLGFAEQRHFARMYHRRNAFPGLSQNHYLICSPEFG